jgi:uncharacterized protein (TIGR03067 family)
MERIMRALSCFVLLAFALIASHTQWTCAEEKAPPLDGIWIAASGEVEGTAMPKEVLEKIRFTFKGEKLLIRGESNADKDEIECSFKRDTKQDPRHIDITTPENGGTTLAGIYELKGDELKVCFLHPKAKGERPKKFETIAESELTLIVFKRKKA